MTRRLCLTIQDFIAKETAMSTPTPSRVVEVAVPLVAALAAGLVARALLSGSNPQALLLSGPPPAPPPPPRPGF